MAVLLESALRITVLAAAVAVGLRILRVSSPRAAHHAWTGVCALMLLLPAIVAWAPEAVVPILPSRPLAAAVGAPSRTSATVVAPITVNTTTGPERTSPGLTWLAMAAGVYAGGALMLLTGLAFAVWRARTMIRQARRVGGRLVHPRCITPITLGLWSPVVILPPNWIEWEEEDLIAVLAHEEEHVRRRDPLVTFITLINRAVFWFHPLAWWLRREISTLSERACDVTVLSRGHDADRYAAVLLGFARTAAAVGGRIGPLGTAMPGAGLQRRLQMLEASLHVPRSRRRMAWVTAAYLVTVVICAETTPTRAQMPSTSANGPAAWRTYSSRHFEIFYTREHESLIPDVAREAEAAYQGLVASLKYDLTDSVALVVVGGDPSRADGPAALNVVRRSSRQTIVLSIDDPRLGAITHELTHAFTMEIVPKISSTAPWLMEGFAEHARGVWDTANLAKVRSAVLSNGIPAVSAMTDTCWGQALFDYIAAQSGEDGVRRFFFALRSGSAVADAIQMAFSESPEAFDRAFAAYMKERFGSQ